jgi:hypothetical protein
MGLRLDQVQFASSLPNYINIGTVTGTISISGTVANSTTTNFTTSITVSNKNNRSDIYASNAANGTKQLISGSNYLSNDVSPGGGVYQHKSSEFIQLKTSQSSGNVSVTISVNNFTGASVTLITQTITIEVVQYMLPY